MNLRKLFTLVSLLGLSLSDSRLTAEATLRSHGVLGNSGAAGDTLILYPDRALSDRVQSGGLALDAEGYLWAFAGASGLNRYAADGRLIESRTLPSPFQRGRRSLTLSGNTLVLLAADRLWTLDIHSPANTRPTDLQVSAKAVSLNAREGKVVFIGNNKTIWQLDVSSGRQEEITQLPEGAREGGIALLPDGTIYVDRTLRISPDGSREPVEIPGNGATLQWANGHLYSFAWHTTVQRLDARTKASPGVVYGGSSGSFIGNLPKDGELHHPSGIVHLGGHRYAVTGEHGVLHLLEWQSEQQAFQSVRRIGAIHRAAGLAIDPQGRVWWNTGYWNWDDRPAAILKNTTWTTRRDNDDWQVDILASGALSGLASEALIRNAVDFPTPYGRGNDGRYDRDGIASIQILPKKTTGAVILGAPGAEQLLVVDAQGKGARLRVDASGNARGLVGPVTLRLESEKPAITSLARVGDTLYAADGNTVVRLSASADGFSETARFPAWGPGTETRFGSVIYIDGDGDQLWVSDSEKDRVLIFTPEDKGLRLVTHYDGDPTLGKLKEPRRLSATAGRAVVLDWGNQRLVRLELNL